MRRKQWETKTLKAMGLAARNVRKALNELPNDEYLKPRDKRIKRDLIEAARHISGAMIQVDFPNYDVDADFEPVE